MAIKRACTYSVAISTPLNPSEYSAIEVTFAQDQVIKVQKTKSELQLTNSGVIVQLTQEETKLFDPSQKSPMGTRIGNPAYLQIRVFNSATNAPGSRCFPIEVYDSLSQVVLTSG